jgi:nicotinate-nucleotide pyrophosphorylase (carboxylating)
MDLGGGVMIKDNHIAAAGSIRRAIESVRATAPHTLRIECEVTNTMELEEAVSAGADIVLLDNMNDAEVKAAVVLARRLAGARPIALEASGGITFERLKSLANTGVDYISSGALTHSVVAADISLDFLA